MLKNGQISEVEYDEIILKDFIDHKDEIIEGTGTEDIDVALYGTQTLVNEDSPEDMLEEGEAVIEK